MMGGVTAVSGARAAPTSAPTGSPVPSSSAGVGAPLPAPNVELTGAADDVMTMMYGLTAKQRDEQTADKKNAVQASQQASESAYQDQQAEAKQALEDQKKGGIFGGIMKAIGTITDAVVGGNPLQDLAKTADDALGTKTFEVVYDFIRPDAILNAAALLASKATGSDKITEAYDMGAAPSSLKTRFQGAADATNEQKIMSVGYDTVRDAIAGAMVTVGTAGVGTATIAAIALSASLAVESKLDLLGKMGIHGGLAEGLRIGAQVYSMAFTVGASFATAGVREAASTGTKIATNVINGVDKTTQGVSTIGQAAYSYSAEQHTTTAAADANTQQQNSRQIDRLVAGLREISQSYERSLGTIASTLQVRDQTSLQVAQSIA